MKMANDNGLAHIKENIQKSVAIPKCRKCGCLRETLDGIKAVLLANLREDRRDFLNGVEAAAAQLEPSEYA